MLPLPVVVGRGSMSLSMASVSRFLASCSGSCWRGLRWRTRRACLVIGCASSSGDVQGDVEPGEQHGDDDDGVDGDRDAFGGSHGASSPFVLAQVMMAW